MSESSALLLPNLLSKPTIIELVSLESNRLYPAILVAQAFRQFNDLKRNMPKLTALYLYDLGESPITMYDIISCTIFHPTKPEISF